MVLPRYPFFGIPAVYVDPTIVSFVAEPAVAELGSTVDEIVLKWRIAKGISTLVVDGVVLAPNERMVTKTGPFTTNQSWSMKAGDEQTSVNAKATLSFVNTLYSWFAATAPANSSAMKALDFSDLSDTLERSITIGSPDGKVFCIAYPARLRTPKLGLIKSSGVWEPVNSAIYPFTDYVTSTVSFTNDSGYTENYTVITFNAQLPGSNVIQINKGKPPAAPGFSWVED